jgi:hypothetical protein
MGSFKSVVVVNEKLTLPLGLVANAVAHVAQSLGRQLADHSDARFVDYRDRQGRRFPTVSWWPMILLGGAPNRMWVLFDSLTQAHAPRCVYLDSMIDGGSETQLERTNALERGEMNLIAVAAFASSEVLAPLTKRFSLWRP